MQSPNADARAASANQLLKEPCSTLTPSFSTRRPIQRMRFPYQHPDGTKQASQIKKAKQASHIKRSIPAGWVRMKQGRANP